MTDADISTEERAARVAAASEEAKAALQALGRKLGDDLAEPEEDEGDSLVFVRNGWIRFTIAGKPYKLRRPFLGELRDLEVAWETDQEALTMGHNQLKLDSQELLDEAAKLEAEAAEIEGQTRRKIELDIEASHLALKASAESRKLQRKAQDLRAEWWAQVFKLLTPHPQDPPPADQVPSWVANIDLQQRAIAHWQSAPLGRGG